MCRPDPGTPFALQERRFTAVQVEPGDNMKTLQIRRASSMLAALRARGLRFVWLRGPLRLRQSLHDTECLVQMLLRAELGRENALHVAAAVDRDPSRVVE